MTLAEIKDRIQELQEDFDKNIRLGQANLDEAKYANNVLGDVEKARFYLDRVHFFEAQAESCIREITKYYKMLKEFNEYLKVILGV